LLFSVLLSPSAPRPQKSFGESCEPFLQGLISPKKDYGTGELLLGAASVAQGTFLLIDETALEPGQLVDQGVKNVQAIHSLVGAKELVAGDLLPLSCQCD
jgi:hypothetical protein